MPKNSVCQDCTKPRLASRSPNAPRLDQRPGLEADRPEKKVGRSLAKHPTDQLCCSKAIHMEWSRLTARLPTLVSGAGLSRDRRHLLETSWTRHSDGRSHLHGRRTHRH